ncbi:hypothetical protein FA15DRAFT_664504 [Coprinopsis marcescibilis]|uniref:Fe2OG dioxygenase domain-containing protein n=1 Tax=Coprinopsis marcescibilis TaxID=230819 RepID=A0A5C3L9L1_COPMA|nr:hypothetical protein FA15DRAFT_664504 [Coprinopsis marcescibilis]
MEETGPIEVKNVVVPGVIYLAEFISEEEEEHLIRKIKESSQQKWKALANRRLQIWGGEITPKGTLCRQPLPDFVDTYPDLVSRIKATGMFPDSPHKQPNHIIMNEYLPGQGIMPHEDGPVYHPVVATLSLGSHCVFNYYKYKDHDPDPSSSSSGVGRAVDMNPVFSLLLERRSLVISFSDMYTSHLHGIDEKTEDFIVSNASQPSEASTAIRIDNFHLIQNDIKETIQKGQPLKRETRWSLTCRDVTRTSNLAARPFTTGRK